MRVYRYEITESWGSMEEQVKVGAIIRESEFKGDDGIWVIARLDTGEPTGGFAGTYLNTITIEDDVLA
jgi:hypothetical protein